MSIIEKMIIIISGVAIIWLLIIGWTEHGVFLF